MSNSVNRRTGTAPIPATVAPSTAASPDATPTTAPPSAGTSPQDGLTLTPQATTTKPTKHVMTATQRENKWIAGIFKANLKRAPKASELNSYRQEIYKLKRHGKTTAQIQSALVHRVRSTGEYTSKHGPDGLPANISIDDLHLVENAIYNEADGLSFNQQEKVAQAIANYSHELGTSVRNVVMGGRGGISEAYLADDPRRRKNNGADLTQKQRVQIERAAVEGLERNLPHFKATHWRGDGQENHFF